MARLWLAFVAFFLLPAAMPARAESGPLAQAESSAGPAATTLLVYDSPARPYSLMDLRGVVGSLLTRVDTKVVLRSASDLLPGDLPGADYIVWLGAGTQPGESRLGQVPPSKPLLVCGMPPREAGQWPGARALGKFPPVTKSWPAATIQIGPAVFDSPVSSVIAASATEGDARVLASMQAGGRRSDLAWREGNILWFPCLPLEEATGAAFSALLPDFYGFDPGPGGVLLTIDDFHPGCDPAALRRAADYLSAKGRPFAVTVRMPPRDWDAVRMHDFVSALAYAQARRGRVFLFPSAGRLWDAEQDRPAAPAEIEAAVAATVEDFARCVANGILPLGVRLPGSGAGSSAVARFSQSFGLGLGAVLPSDATATATLMPVTITRPGGRMLLLPGGTPVQEGAELGRKAGTNLLRIGGTILALQVPAWLPFDRMSGLLSQVAERADNFLDPADSAAWISTTVGALWTPHAAAPAPVFFGKASLRAYDANARLLFERECSAGDAVAATAPSEARFMVLTPCAP